MSFLWHKRASFMCLVCVIPWNYLLDEFAHLLAFYLALMCQLCPISEFLPILLVRKADCVKMGYMQFHLSFFFQGVGLSGKDLGLGGISIKFKVQIPLGANNSLGPIRR
jgi:hypothetical protein